MKISVLFRREEESWAAFRRRIAEESGPIIVVLGARESVELERESEELAEFFRTCRASRGGMMLATKHPALVLQARERGIRVIDRTRAVRHHLAGHPNLAEAVRILSPHLWRQQLRSRLQEMGLLSLPKLRVWLLVGLSGGLFAFVILRLLPSAEIRVWPRQETVSQTGNIILAGSGAENLPSHVRTMTLIPLRVELTRVLTFDQISEEFTGTSAETLMTIKNDTAEPWSFRAGTRLTNQAGMVFRTLAPIVVEPKGEATALLRSDPEDIYGKFIGARGNVPAGLTWDFPGLSPADQAHIKGENRGAATGGTTASRRVLKERDLQNARKLLEEELSAAARQRIDEEIAERNQSAPDGELRLLDYAELTKVHFTDFILSREFLGQEVTTVPVEGGVVFTMFAYDSQAILDLLRGQLRSHVESDKQLLTDSLALSNLVVHVVEYDDDFRWIKLTVDLTGRERFILDPLTPTGAKFGQRVRDLVANAKIADAVSIIKNLPEVERVQIRLFPPWSGVLPAIKSNIAIVPQ